MRAETLTNSMNRIKRLVFATNNQHKLEEARRIVSDGFEIVSLAEIGCHDEIPETADTLEGNALIKARWVRDRYGYDCFADDTGLMVDALGGAPGVYSARYAGEHCTPADNVKKLLHEMEGVADRHASFATCIALAAQGEEHCFTGSVEGDIATECHGDGGFGYDPVFRARETGKCFAEMSADDKNAISHRGRALRKLRDFLLLCLILFISCAIPAKAESWRIHPSLDGQYQHIFDTQKYVYFIAYMTKYVDGDPVGETSPLNIIRWDKEAEEFDYLNSSNILSENTVAHAAYNYDDKYLLIAYRNGNIDVLYDNGDVVNIPALMLADADLSRQVNSISFDSESGFAYLATDFGYVILDVKKGEVETSRIFHTKLYSATRFADKILVSTDDGLYYGSPNAFNLSELTKIPDFKRTLSIMPFGQRLYLLYGTRQNRQVSYLVATGDGFSATAVSSAANETDLNRGEKMIYIVSPDRIRTFDQEYKETSYRLETLDKGSIANSFDGRVFWFGSGRNGIASKSIPSDGGSSWTLTRDYMQPNAANSLISQWMAFHPEYGVLVRNHGYGYVNPYIETPDLISAYKNMQWTPMSISYRGNNPAMLINTPNGLVIDPNNTDQVYCGSPKGGILRLDLKNVDNSLHFSKPSDEFHGYGKPGFVEIVPDNHSTSWPQQCIFGVPAFDSSGYMWIPYIDADANEASNYTTAQLWYWSPSDRAATTSQATYRPFKVHTINNLPVQAACSVFALNSGNNKNTILFFAGAVTSGIRVINHHGNPENENGWDEYQMSSITDQDGKKIDLSYVRSWLEDPATGLVWVGYTKGIFTFNPRTALTGSPDARRIKVPRNDGTNLADYLLDGIAVYAMTIDSQGRKWFGTQGAGLVCTSADGRTIIKTYTTDNSDIVDNNVYGICFNPSTNSIMVSTSLGLCELFLSGEDGGSEGNQARAYPNPVNPDYFGYVTIDNLPENATVKIVDAAGNLMKDLGLASSGQLQWDVTNLNHKRVPAGVYFVLAANGPNDESFAKVSKILVIN